MNISICITTFNEEGSIGPLLDSLLSQSKKANEIVIVDGGSKDRTLEIIRHYQKKESGIKVLAEKCSRAKGRNLGIEIAKGEIIAVTDAGCVADRDWLKNITLPFATDRVSISAGFYKMTGNTPMSQAMAVFLGVTPRKFNIGFLPSTRSVAFRKTVWEEIGGFPDEAKNSAEDTYFNYSALKLGMKYARVKNAIVEWGMPQTLKEFYEKIRNYAFWDGRTKIWMFPGKGLTSHNIKALSILFRYLVGVTLFIYSFKFVVLLPYLIILFFGYLFWAFRKVYLEKGKVEIAIWGPVLQLTSDFAVVSGFLSGVLRR